MAKTLLFTVLATLVVTSSLFAQASVDVGDAAPDFELQDSAGKTYKLSEFRGDKVVVLEFFRSGDW